MREAEGTTTRSHGDPIPLLATKLVAPRLRPDAVRRPRLERLLTTGRQGVLTLVTAPAGFGKSTLVTQWLQDDPAPAVWLTCSPENDDPRRFFAYVFAGLGASLPGVAHAAAARLTAPSEVQLSSVLTEALNDLVDAGPVVLVLDDYHTITHPDVHAGVSFLLENAPEGLHVVIVSRGEPPLPRSRLRASGLLNELTRDDLRATRDETGTFLRDVMGLDLDDAAVTAFERRTEGWFAGLQFAALSLRADADTGRVIDAFRGDHHFVLDYLAEEVLRGLDDDHQHFLLETASLERLSGPLCDAVTGRPGSQERLERLERQNVFTQALDERRTTFRYHALFADALLRRVATLPPDHVRALHARAGRWHAAHDDIDDAVRHLVAADALDEAAALVERAALPSLQRDGPAPLSNWLSAFPEATLAHDPRLAIAGAWARLAAGHVDEAEVLTDIAARDVTANALSIAALRASFAFLRATLQRPLGTAEELESLADAALARLGPDQGWQRGTLLIHLGVVGIHTGRWDAGQRALRAAEAAFTSADSRYGVLAARYGQADLLRWRGRLREAEAGYRAMLDLATRRDGRRYASAGFALFGLARLELERDELAAAAAHAAEGLALGGALDPQLRAEGSLTMAQVRLAQGDADAASAALDASASAGDGDVMTPVARPVAALRAGVGLLRGDLAAVEAWLERSTPPEPLAMGPALHVEHVTRARALLALGRADEAAAWLERLRDLATRHDRRSNLAEILVLQAAAAAAAGHGARATAYLERALALAEPEGQLRPFAAEAVVVARVLAALPAAPTTGFAGRVARHLDPGITTAAPARPAVVAIEPLSDREHTVLRLLVAGAANKEIARALGVSVNTVKSHVRNVYAKLGVRNRGRLVALTLELGLLD